MRQPALLVVSFLLVPLVLALDAHATAVEQAALGLVVALVLGLALAGERRPEQALVLTTLLVATAGELFLTQVWAAYRYRFGNVPLYVVFGHGLVAWVGLEAQRRFGHLRWPVWLVLALSSAWMFAGLFTGHPDVEGAAFAPFFLPLLVIPAQRTAHAATWAFAASIELWGTWFHTWHWAPVLPWLELPAANPPSGAAGGYCWFAVLASGLLMLARRLPVLRRLDEVTG